MSWAVAPAVVASATSVWHVGRNPTTSSLSLLLVNAMSSVQKATTRPQAPLVAPVTRPAQNVSPIVPQSASRVQQADSSMTINALRLVPQAPLQTMESVLATVLVASSLRQQVPLIALVCFSLILSMQLCVCELYRHCHNGLYWVCEWQLLDLGRGWQ